MTRIMRPHPPLPPANEAFDTKAKARFWMKVSPAPADVCWTWLGAKGKSGYGNFGFRKGATYLAHRVAYEITSGSIPVGLDIDHLCRNKTCVNPAHLEPVTFLVNMRRRYGIGADGHQTHCPRGHELTPENTERVWRNGRRRCLACTQEMAEEVS